jgi:HK97 family phage major capsid protein|tara:strand:+ start:1177 stop:2331 length:1155 start_codon:yes stop_codon:yes gene_type:complete
MSEFKKAQEELRANLTLQIQESLDAAEERGGLDAETTEKINRIETDIRRADEAISIAARNEQRSVEASAAAGSFVPASESRSDEDVLRSIVSGEVRSHNFEKRGLVSSANTVPKSFYDEVFSVARLAGPMLDVSQVIATSTGESLTIPTLTAYSTATIKGEGATIAESDPTFSSITLGAFKYSFLVPVSNELLNDAGFNLTSLIAEQAGNAIGFAVNDGLTTGAGTTEPTGVMTSAGAGIVGATGVTGAFTADDLINLQYTLDGAARRLPGVAYMAAGASIGAMRTLKDGAGQYLYQVNVGQPDSFAGYDVVENPAIAATGLDAKSVAFGHLPSYKVRMAGGLQIAQSSDYSFNTDQTTFRVLMRVDGGLTHAGHIKTFAGGAS